LNSLVTYRGIQPELITTVASRLLEIGSDSTSSETTVAASKELLTTLVERHPAQVDQARSARVAAGKETMENLVDEDKSSMAFVNAYSADAAARIRSIAPLLRAMGVHAGEDIDVEMDETVEDRQSAIEKIVLLLGDDDKAVIEALYTNLEQNASTFLDILQPARYLDAVASQFDTAKPVPAIRSQHLRFVAKHIDHSSLSETDSVAVFMQVVFPSLLSTANRASFSQIEWSIVAEKGFFQKHELTGTKDFRKAVEQAKSTDMSSKEQGMALNLVLNNAVVVSLSTSGTLSRYQAALVERLASAVPTTRLMAYLVLGRLLETLPGTHTVELGVDVLSAIDDSARKMTLHDLSNSEEPLSDIYLRAIFTKSDDPKTTARATISLMSSFCKLSRPDTGSINWFSKSSQSTLATTLYRHANSDTLPPALARSLLRSLFASLREDALVFFASVWTDVDQLAALRVAALRHATAFVKAYALGTDFQMVLPSILVAFTSSNGAIREAAVALLKVVNRSASNETKNYYAIDTFYGESTGMYSSQPLRGIMLMYVVKVQLLKHGDLIRYLQAIIPALEEIQVDSTRLAAVHSSALSMNHGRGRKETG
jgi:U3 small nucleolar RNA-associated protein 10